MTDVKDGIPLFETVSPEQIGSVNLVLACLSEGPREVEPTVRALLMRSGVSGGLVNPRDCIHLSMELGLINETSGEIKLSPLGEELLSAASWPPYNLLTEVQGRRLLDEMIQRPDCATPLSNLLRKMWRGPDGSLQLIPGSVLLSRGEEQCLRALQSLFAVRYCAGVLIMAPGDYDGIIDVLGTSAVVSEEELLRVLELQRIRAVAAENHVMEMEIRRLTDGGRGDLAGLVERIASRDVAAGYDIRSFELDGSDRLIEVKSSTNIALRFFLSSNECRFLHEHDSTAWIYFVPRVHELPYLSRPIVAIPNPSKWIEERATITVSECLVEFPSSIIGHPAAGAAIVWLPRKDGATFTGSAEGGQSLGV